jgi:hypothetical protein
MCVRRLALQLGNLRDLDPRPPKSGLELFISDALGGIRVSVDKGHTLSSEPPLTLLGAAPALGVPLGRYDASLVEDPVSWSFSSGLRSGANSSSGRLGTSANA